jgi:membrane protease YdiL (CAAX protease family)
MSTLAQVPAPPTTEPVMESTTGQWIFVGGVAVWALVGIIVLIRRYAVHRPSKVAGHDRLPPHAGQWPVWIGFIVGFLTWLIASIAFGIILAILHRPFGASGPATNPEAPFDGSELALLSVIGPVAALMATVVVLPLFQRRIISWLGFELSDLARGARWGALAFLVVLPCMFVIEIGIDQIYRAVHYEHPSEHDLLRVMRQGSPAVRWLSIIGAIVVAPVFEELLFRGLLQTALTEWITRLSRPRVPAQPYAFPVIYAAPAVSATSGEPSSAAEVYGNPVWPPGAPMAAVEPSMVTPADLTAPVSPTDAGAAYATDPATMTLPTTISLHRHRAAWIAILVTAGLFAIIHPLWTAPIIFALAIALGYVYERTGNLWASITIHMLFNATSTILVLLGME